MSVKCQKRSKLRQVFGNEHFAREVLFYVIRPASVIIVGFPSQVGQHHSLHTGARRHLPNVVRAQMSFGHLSLDSDLFIGSHDLPWSVMNSRRFMLVPFGRAS
jgi:hypothetical protein